MTGDTVECFNCGRPNPSWAQVCRSCGVPLRGSGRKPQSGPLPTDRDSLIALGATLATIAAAVLIGLVLSGIIPESAPVASTTPTPEPSGTPIPSESAAPSASTEPSAEPTPELLGTVTFGYGLNESTREVLDQTDTFGPGTRFCHSISMTQPFKRDKIQEEILRVEDNGDFTVVQKRKGSNLTVSRDAQIAGFCAGADGLINGWGPGDYILRDYRSSKNGPQLIAQGNFSLTN